MRGERKRRSIWGKRQKRNRERKRRVWKKEAYIRGAGPKRGPLAPHGPEN